MKCEWKVMVEGSAFVNSGGSPQEGRREAREVEYTERRQMGGCMYMYI